MSKAKEAVALLEVGQVEEALKILAQIEKDEDILAKYEAKDVYYQFGFYEEGIALVKNLLKDAPEDGELLVSLSSMYIDIEEDEEAIDLLSRVDEDDPFYLASLLMLADLYQMQGLFEVAEAKLFTAKEQAPDELIIDMALAELMYSIGQFHRAIPFYEKVLDANLQIDGISITERLAECYGTLGKYEEALTLYEKLEDETPDMLFKHGYIAKQLKRNKIAIQKWEELLAIDPDYFSTYVELAEAYEDEGQFDDALKTLEEGLKHDEFNKELYLKLARVYVKTGSIKEAISYAKEAVALDYDYKEAILLLVNLYEQEDDFEAIVDLLLEIKQTNSEDGDYDFELAKAYEELEEYDVALQSYEKAYLALNYDAEFLKSYGHFLLEDGKREEAIKILNEYLEIEAGDEDTRALVDRISFPNDM